MNRKIRCPLTAATAKRLKKSFKFFSQRKICEDSGLTLAAIRGIVSGMTLKAQDHTLAAINDALDRLGVVK